MRPLALLDSLGWLPPYGYPHTYQDQQSRPVPSVAEASRGTLDEWCRFATQPFLGDRTYDGCAGTDRHFIRIRCDQHGHPALGPSRLYCFNFII